MSHTQPAPGGNSPGLPMTGANTPVIQHITMIFLWLLQKKAAVNFPSSSEPPLECV